MVLAIVIAAIPGGHVAFADAGPSAESKDESAVDEATTPLPVKTQITFKPAYTFPNGNERYHAELQFEAVLPYSGVVIPGVEAPGFWSLARLQLSAENQEQGQTVSSGLGDLMFVDLCAHHVGPFNLGAGFGAVFPMATDPALGQGKIQLGPAVAARLPGDLLNIAVLVQNLYSVAGDNQAAGLAYVSVQPFVTLHLPADFFVASDATMDFYWRGGRSTVPIDLGFGRAFSEHFVGSLQLWYTLADANQGDIRVRAVLDFQTLETSAPRP